MRPRLAEAEVLHDGMLAAAGRLDGARPTTPFFAKYHPYRDAEWSSFKPFVTRKEMVANHRAVYLPVLRGVLPEVLELFDFASPDRCVAERTQSILPTQGLYLLNNPRVAELAAVAASRSLSLGGQGTQRVVWIFRTVLGRSPLPVEVERVLDFVGARGEPVVAKAELPAADKPAGQRPPDEDSAEARWADVCQMLFASVEHRLIR
jgi:hypothetical protein